MSALLWHFPPSNLPHFCNSLPPQLYPCIQVLTTEANKCLIVAGEERPHRSRSLFPLWCGGWGGGSRFEDTGWEGKTKMIKKREDRKGEHFVRWRGGRGRSRGQSRGNWCCYHGQPDLADVLLAAFPPTSWITENTKKEQCTFPSMFTLVLLFYSSFFSRRKHKHTFASQA